MTARPLSAALFAAAVLAAASARAESVTASVANVLAADTVIVSVRRTTETVKLWGLSAPAYGPAAEEGRRHLTNRVFRTIVTLDTVETGGGRRGAILKTVDGRNVNVEMVRMGFASWNKAEMPEDAAMADAENYAKENRLGLWAPRQTDPGPVPDGPAAPGPVPPALLHSAKMDMAAHAAVDPGQIQVIVAEAMTWPDSSLGCPQPGRMYAQVLTPGYRIVLRSPKAVYYYHCGQSNNFIRCRIEPAR